MRTVNSSFTPSVLPTVGATSQEPVTFGIGSYVLADSSARYLATESLDFILTENGKYIIVT